jgi:hypothetical protein
MFFRFPPGAPVEFITIERAVEATPEVRDIRELNDAFGAASETRPSTPSLCNGTPSCSELPRAR